MFTKELGHEIATANSASKLTKIEAWRRDYPEPMFTTVVTNTAILRTLNHFSVRMLNHFQPTLSSIHC